MPSCFQKCNFLNFCTFVTEMSSFIFKLQYHCSSVFCHCILWPLKDERKQNVGSDLEQTIKLQLDEKRKCSASARLFYSGSYQEQKCLGH